MKIEDAFPFQEVDSDYPEWKRLLHGGFAFETAHFGVHPCDEERAEQMYYQSLVGNIPIERIKAEAQHYLKEKGCCREYIEEQVADVQRFYRRMKSRSKKKKRHAWLITLEDQSSEKPIEERVISIRSSKTPDARIKEFIEQLYIAMYYPLICKFQFSSRSRKMRQNNPYRAKSPYSRYRGIMYCGDNPKIVARMVADLAIYSENGSMKIQWENISIPDFVLTPSEKAALKAANRSGSNPVLPRF